MSKEPFTDNRLVADVGGTNTRLALFDPAGNELRVVRHYVNRDYANFEDTIEHWLQALDEPAPTHCCIAVAAPPSGDQVTMVNMDWSFSCRALARRFSLEQFRRINDFEGNAYALPHLKPGERETLRSTVATGEVLATMGPGTGLGGATLERVAGVARARASEPGHMGLSPATSFELELFKLLHGNHGEVHAELLLSGPGLLRLYQCAATVRGEQASAGSAAEVTTSALEGNSPLSVLALETFCALLGSACGDFVLANGAYGGLYLAGGIIPRMIPFLRASTFQQRFSSKGEMTGRMEQVALHVITTPQPGLIGAAYAPMQAPGS